MADDASPCHGSQAADAFGSGLGVVRDAAGITQAKLAARASLRTATVSLYENGRLSLTLSTICVLAHSLGMPPAALPAFGLAAAAEAVAALEVEVPMPDEW